MELTQEIINYLKTHSLEEIQSDYKRYHVGEEITDINKWINLVKDIDCLGYEIYSTAIYILVQQNNSDVTEENIDVHNIDDIKKTVKKWLLNDTELMKHICKELGIKNKKEIDWSKYQIYY